MSTRAFVSFADGYVELAQEVLVAEIVESGRRVIRPRTAVMLKRLGVLVGLRYLE
jgi:hypothetical protein